MADRILVLDGAGGDDVFIAKLTSGGQPVWAMGHGDLANQRVSVIRTMPDGSFLVSGNFDSSITFETTHQSAGGSDIFVAVLAN